MTISSETTRISPPAGTLPTTTACGWLLYDGDCGICRKLVNRGKWIITNRDLDVAPLQAEWVGQAFQLSEEELLRDVRLLLQDGTNLRGADVYRYVARRTWWLWPLWLLSIMPGIRQLVDWSYRKFADNRHRFSSTCGLS